MAKRLNNDSEEDKKRRLNRRELNKALRIFRFVLPYKITFIIGFIFLIFSTLTVLAMPILAGQFWNVAIGKTEWFFTSIESVAWAFAAVLVLQGFFSFLRVYLFAQVSERTMADIRATLYGKLITLPISFFEKRRVGELNSRITSDISQLQDTLSFTIAEFIRQILTIGLGTVYLFVRSPQLTIFMTITFPILIIAAIIFGRFIRKLAKQSQDQLAQSNVIVEETMQAIQAVKAFTNEWFELNRYKKSLNQVVNTSIRVAKYRGLFATFVIIVLFGGLVAVLTYGAYLVKSQAMEVGELTTFIMFSILIGGSLGGTAELYGQLQKTVGASERILEILDEESEINLADPKPTQGKSNTLITDSTMPVLAGNGQVSSPIKGKIEFENVQFSYPTRQDVEVLKGINLTVNVGEKIALVGHSGAGKSTIVQLLNRFYGLEQGKILVDDKNCQAYELSFYRRHIGIVPQEVLLFGGTIQENVAYGNPQATEAEVIEACQKANAWQFIVGFPEGLQTLVGERGVKLSGGQRQRIAIARAILKNPKILILDEATSSLDAESEKLVQEALDELMKNRTTIIIAHRLATIRKVDKIYVINEGKVAESGTHEELSILTNGIYNNLVKLQFEMQINEN
ncbi:MAG: ABC transporter transmembrane domain-containing protein [Microscillaceae bacterium]|jgi:ABC-type multidrug transport system fused ATPase/permease subunit|nr:ABC transporter transmembrane domain-containing protein [Microscillaceae bacterium]